MFFLQATQAPIQVRFMDLVLHVPKMTMDQLIPWSMDVQNERNEKITAEMTDVQRREYMSMYPQVAPDITEMGRLVRTPEGTRRVIEMCLTSPEVKSFHYKTKKEARVPTEQELAVMWQNNSFGRLVGLAWELADLKDTSQVNPYPEETSEDTDPLTSTGKASSPG